MLGIGFEWLVDEPDREKCLFFDERLGLANVQYCEDGVRPKLKAAASPNLANLLAFTLAKNLEPMARGFRIFDRSNERIADNAAIPINPASTDIACRVIGFGEFVSRHPFRSD